MKSIRAMRPAPKSVVTIMLAICIIVPIVLACLNPWSPSFCADGRPNAETECVWTALKAGAIDDPPDFSSEQSQCWAIQDQFGGQLYVGSQGGAGWLYTCCRVICDAESAGCTTGFWDEVSCECFGDPTPIIISAMGNRLRLTDRADGVLFNINASGGPDQTPWTTAGSDDSFLALDRNGNGLIDDGSELFGDSTPQPDSPTPNGFLALAVYDDPTEGGNNDGWIDAADPIFDELLLWTDLNHDGTSQASELIEVSATDLIAVDTRCREARRIDRYGNQFRYTAKVKTSSQHNRRFAVDVIFNME